jgi:hypothetical protein
MKGAKGGSWDWSWLGRREIFGKWGFESGEITDSSERITGCKWRHSFDCAVLVFGEGRRDGLNTEHTEEEHPSREALKTNGGHGEEWGRDGPLCGGQALRLLWRLEEGGDFHW